MTLSINPVPLPTGGVIGVNYTTAVSGNITLQRSPYPSISWTTLYTGLPANPRGDTQFFLDTGDAGTGPLQPTSQYIYQIIDITGTLESNPVTPVAFVNLDRTYWDQIFITIIQGAVNSVQLPPGINRARVSEAMPLQGLIPMPFVVLNNDLIQQEEVPIGQALPTLGEGFVQPPYVNIATQTAFVRNLFRISVFSQNANERSFYRDLVVATFRANLYYLFQQIGEDITHTFQATNYQATKSGDGLIPGFYASDIMLEFTGTQNITLNTNYGVIDTIDMQYAVNTFEDSVDSVTDEVIVPNDAPTGFP